MQLIRRVIFFVFIILFSLSGCATLQSAKPVITPIDQFPDFIVPDGPNINPVSDDSAVSDVDVLALSKDIKRLLDESVIGIKNQRKRLDALVDVITQNVRFFTTDDKYGTKTATETFETGTGNCLSFSNLFVSMARYVGFKSKFQEISTPPNWIKDGEVLLFTRHIGASVDLSRPVEYVLNIVNDFGSEKVVYWINDETKYVFAPLLPLSLLHTISQDSTRSIPDKRALAQYYNNIGSQHLAEGNAPDAFRYFVKAIKVDPQLSFVWTNLGVVYSRNNQPEAAENAYMQALSINQDKDKVTAMTIMSNLARLYARRGKEEEAALYEEKVRSYRNMNPYYHYSIGEIAFYDKQYAQSVEHFKEAIKRKPDYHQFHYALALSYLKLGEIKRAEESMSKAISYAPDKQVEHDYSQIWKKFSEHASTKTERP